MLKEYYAIDAMQYTARLQRPHAELSIKAFAMPGRHCGCTIPMGMSIDELYEVIEARKKSGKNYMFLETTVFGREFFYVQELYKKGEFGRARST